MTSGKLLVLLSKGKTMIRAAVHTKWWSYSTYPGNQVDAIKLSAAGFNRQPVKNNPRQQTRSLTMEGGARGNNLLRRSSAHHFRKVGPFNLRRADVNRADQANAPISNTKR